MTKTQRALATMYAGLALTIAAMVVLFVDHATGNVLAGHIRAGYPTYSPARVDTAVTAYLIMLTVIGVLGVASWLWTIRTVRAGKGRVTATVMFVVGTSIALTALLVRDTSGDTGLPPLLGWAGIIPCVAGLSAVVLLWRRS